MKLEDFQDLAHIFRNLKITSYFFDFILKKFIFLRLREKTKELFETREEEIFYPKYLSGYFMEDFNEIQKRYSNLAINVQEIESLLKEEYVLIKRKGDRDIFFDLINKFINKFTLENFIEYENRYTLLYLFTEFENYFFKCFKYILTQRPEIINETKVSIKELKEANGNIVKIIQSKAELEAYSKFDHELFIENLIEKKIHNKFYNTYTEIFNYADKVLGIKHSIPKTLIDVLDFFKQIRNLYTHGDGIINQIFLKRIKQKKPETYKIGDKFPLTNKFLGDLGYVLDSTITIFDRSIVEQFPELLHK